MFLFLVFAKQLSDDDTKAVVFDVSSDAYRSLSDHEKRWVSTYSKKGWVSIEFDLKVVRTGKENRV